MSKETMEWLNTMVLVGMTDQRGGAWHRNDDLQGEPNHYPGAIPVADVNRRLFGWTPVAAEMRPTYETVDGPVVIDAPDRVVVCRPMGAFGEDDPGKVFGVFKEGYPMSSYRERLIDRTASILEKSSGELVIGTAGLLRGGAVGWLQVERDETFSIAGDLSIRPFLLAATSFNGTLSSEWGNKITNTVCDNTMAMALREEGGETYKLKNTRNATFNVGTAQEALNVLTNIAEAYSLQVEGQLADKVDDARWRKFVNAQFPLATDDGEEKEGRGLTIALRKRHELNTLWHEDERVAPWKGTAFGVVQAINTHTHHFATVKGGDRVGRNAEGMLFGKFDEVDTSTLATLATV